jgi:hypothetical protein
MVNVMSKTGYVEFEAAAKPETVRPRKLLQAASRMKSAIAFAHSGPGRVVMLARTMIGSLGPFGAALWAMYPLAFALTLIGLLFSGAVPV